MSPSSPTPLRPRDICAVLYAQQEPDRYHWSICIPYSSTSVKKMHVKEHAADRFRFEEPLPDENLAVAPAVCVVVKLGECTPKHTVEYIHNLLRAVPTQLPKEEISGESGFSCRVWWKEAVRTLHLHGVLHCPDVHELEREIFQFAGLNDVSQSSRGYMYFVSRRSI